MKIKNADELIEFLRHPKDTIVYLNKHLYELLIEKEWDCPLGNELRKRIIFGLQVYKD